MRSPALNDNEPHVCLYPGWLRALIWAVLLVGSWAFLFGAVDVAQWLYERILLLAGAA
jgi:hypothetical protein